MLSIRYFSLIFTHLVKKNTPLCPEKYNFGVFSTVYQTYGAYIVDYQSIVDYHHYLASSQTLFAVEAVLARDNKPSVAVGT